MTSERSSQLTEEQVLAIKRLLGEGSATQADIARRHGVTQTAINKIARGLIWSHVDGPPVRHYIRPRTTTGFWGITANGAGNRFMANIHENGKTRCLGIFRDPVEAAKVRDARARELGFPREKLNFPDET